MLRSIGSVTFLALLMVGCGGGGGTSGGGGGGASSPPPPPPINRYTVGGTVSGLQGSGLAVQVVVPGSVCGRGCYPHPGHNVGPPLQITSNGPFTFDVDYSGSMGDRTTAFISHQPYPPYQICLMHNAPYNMQ